MRKGAVLALWRKLFPIPPGITQGEAPLLFHAADGTSVERAK